MNRLVEVKLAMGVDKKHKFDDADIGKVASPATGFTHIGVVQGHDVYHRQRNAGNHDFVMTKEGERKIHTHLNTFQSDNHKSHHVNYLQSKPGHGPGAHHLYHHLITKHNAILSTDTQSEGGAAVWHKMSKMKGVHIHAIDAKGVGHHADLSNLNDLRDTHASPADIQKAKDAKDNDEAKRLRSNMARWLVAHKS